MIRELSFFTIYGADASSIITADAGSVMATVYLCGRIVQEEMKCDCADKYHEQGFS
jgi:hypothetical protein